MARVITSVVLAAALATVAVATQQEPERRLLMEEYYIKAFTHVSGARVLRIDFEDSEGRVVGNAVLDCDRGLAGRYPLRIGKRVTIEVMRKGTQREYRAICAPDPEPLAHSNDVSLTYVSTR